MTAPKRPPLVIPKTSRRELIVGVTVGLAVVVLLIFGVLKLTGSAVGDTLTGQITALHFTPHPATTDITIGSGGVQERHSDGDYTFTIHVAAQKKNYTVWVDPTIYRTKKIGDEFSFPRPSTDAP